MTPGPAISALVPMKGHSERVPDKNMRDFAGKALCRWILDTLTASDLIGEVLVNTDSSRIAEAAARLPKVRVIERPEGLRGDFVSMNSIIAHDLKFVRNGHVLQTHATNPLLTGKSLTAAIEAYFEARPDHDSLFSVNAWQSRFYWPDGRAVNHNPSELLRTQDLPPLYEENSCLYLFSADSFQAAGGRRIGLTPRLFPLPRLEAVDIDTEDDFRLAEYLAKNISAEGLA